MLIPSKILKKVSDIELFSSSMKKLTLSEKLENNVLLVIANIEKMMLFGKKYVL